MASVEYVLCSNAHTTKADIVKYLFLGFMIALFRPKRVIHDRPLYGKQLNDMEFGCRPLAAGQN